jgi:hypothetical protein
MAIINLVFENGLSVSTSNVYDTVAPKVSPTLTGTLTTENVTATGTVSLPTTTTIGAVTYTELLTLDGIGSSVQTQLDTKSPAASPTFTGTAVIPNITMSGSINSVSAAELNYVDGVTSAIQTQLNGKKASSVYKGDFAANETVLDFTTNDVVKLTISANTTVTSTVPTAGNTKTLIILTSGGTSRTVTFGTGFLATATLATGTVTGNHFVVSFVSDGTKLIETSRTIAM